MMDNKKRPFSADMVAFVVNASQSVKNAETINDTEDDKFEMQIDITMIYEFVAKY